MLSVHFLVWIRGEFCEVTQKANVHETCWAGFGKE